MGMDIYGRQPSDEQVHYFRACIWSWRPLFEQMTELCADLFDGELLGAMAYNDGAGPEDQATCDEMADRFESAVAEHPNGFTLPAKLLHVAEDGRLVSREELDRNPDLKTRSPYSIEGEHVREWIRFLRHCGGFEVW